MDRMETRQSRDKRGIGGSYPTFSGPPGPGVKELAGTAHPMGCRPSASPTGKGLGRKYIRHYSTPSHRCSLETHGRDTHAATPLQSRRMGIADSAQVIQWPCSTGANQQWKLVPADGSYFNLRARHSGKCLNVVGSSVSDAALLEQRACGPAASFQWSRE